MTKTYLYNRTIEIIFDEGSHTYYLGNEFIPSVTQILSVTNKPALVNWSAKMAVESMQESIQPGVIYDEIQLNNAFAIAKKAHWQKKTDAASLGTIVHSFVDQWIKAEIRRRNGLTSR